MGGYKQSCKSDAGERKHGVSRGERAEGGPMLGGSLCAASCVDVRLALRLVRGAALGNDTLSQDYQLNEKIVLNGRSDDKAHKPPPRRQN